MKFKTKQIFQGAVLAASLIFSQVANAKSWLFQLGGDFSKNWVMDTATLKGDPGNYIYIDEYNPINPYTGTEIRMFNRGGIDIFNFSRYYLDPVVYIDTPLPLYSYWLNDHIDFFWEGTYALSGYIYGTHPANFSLTISYIPEFPEPGTYAMLLAGLGLMGAVARRRRA